MCPKEVRLRLIVLHQAFSIHVVSNAICARGYAAIHCRRYDPFFSFSSYFIRSFFSLFFFGSLPRISFRKTSHENTRVFPTKINHLRTVFFNTVIGKQKQIVKVKSHEREWWELNANSRKEIYQNRYSNERLFFFFFYRTKRDFRISPPPFYFFEYSRRRLP